MKAKAANGGPTATPTALTQSWRGKSQTKKGKGIGKGSKKSNPNSNPAQAYTCENNAIAAMPNNKQPAKKKARI